MVLRVAQGKGPNDREVMLSPTRLEIVRAWWRVSRSRPGSFRALARGIRSPSTR